MKMSSRKLGLFSLAFSVAAMTVWGFGMRVFPAVSSLVFIGLKIAAVSFGIVAALRGSKLWLLDQYGPFSTRLLWLSQFWLSSWRKIAVTLIDNQNV